MVKRAHILGTTLLATGAILGGCAQQGGGQAEQTAAVQPAPVPAPLPKQPSYNLNGGSMTVVTEPTPPVRRTSAALDLVQANTLLDVARQATVRVAKADANETSVINAVALPTTDVAVRLEQALLGRLGNVFSLAVKVTQIGNPSRAFPFSPAGAQELSGQLRDAGVKGYALDVRTEFLDLETTGGTIRDPIERFSLNGQVQARLIDISDGSVIRQATCTDNQQMGTLRDIFVAEGRPVPQSAALAAAVAPAPATAKVQTIAASAADDDVPRPASETSAAALALIQKPGDQAKSQRVEPAATADAQALPPAPAPEAGAVASAVPEAPVETDAQSIARASAASVASAPTPAPQPAVTAPVPQPTAEERVQAALRQAAPTRQEVAEQEAQQSEFQPSPDNPREVPIRRTSAFSGVVQSAIAETPADPFTRRRSATVNVQDDGVKQKAMLPIASLTAAQATAPITLPGPGASGRVSDGAAERFIRKCTEDLWLKIVPE